MMVPRLAITLRMNRRSSGGQPMLCAVKSMRRRSSVAATVPIAAIARITPSWINTQSEAISWPSASSALSIASMT